MTSKEIGDDIRKGSLFVFHKDMNYSASYETRVNREQLEFNVMTGYIKTSDLFILEAVNKLGCTSAECLLHYFREGLRRGEESSICIAKDGNAKDYRSLRNRLEFLARQGLLHCHEYVDRFTHINYFFLCSSEGFRAFNNGLCRREVYNMNLIYKPSFEAFKYVGVNNAMYALSELDGCIKCYNYGKFSVKKLDGTELYETLYGRLLFEYDRIKEHLLIEPAYFAVDEMILSSEENAQRIKERLKRIEEIVTTINRSTQEHATLLILVENGDGLKKLGAIIMESNLKFYTESCFYSSENTVVLRYIKTHNPSDCLFGLSVSKEKLLYQQKNLPFINCLNKGAE